VKNLATFEGILQLNELRWAFFGQKELATLMAGSTA